MRAEKPQTVLYAEIALWMWTAWTCLLGAYQTWAGIPDIERALTDQLQGMITLDPQALLKMIIVGYGALALMSAWVVVKIGAGKSWARSSLMWGFAFEVVCALCPPYHTSVLEYLEDAPDFGLQIYALYALYTKPGRDWFPPKAQPAVAKPTITGA